MYGLVPYNLSPIQQGIQYGHAVVEYANDNFQSLDYHVWSKRDKTFIILNGGTTNLNMERPGSLNLHAQTLEEMGVTVARFHEPDLGDQLTAVVFLVDDRVWDTETWPDFPVPPHRFNPETDSAALGVWVSAFDSDPDVAQRIANMRTFLRRFRLA